jgi:hypothetical protein
LKNGITLLETTLREETVEPPGLTKLAEGDVNQHARAAKRCLYTGAR